MLRCAPEALCHLFRQEPGMLTADGFPEDGKIINAEWTSDANGTELRLTVESASFFPVVTAGENYPEFTVTFTRTKRTLYTPDRRPTDPQRGNPK